MRKPIKPNLANAHKRLDGLRGLLEARRAEAHHNAAAGVIKSLEQKLKAGKGKQTDGSGKTAARGSSKDSKR